MNNLEIIEKIDNSLATGVDATRQAHFQIQQIMQHYKQQAQRQQAKAEQATNTQQSKNNGE